MTSKMNANFSIYNNETLLNELRAYERLKIKTIPDLTLMSRIKDELQLRVFGEQLMALKKGGVST